MYPVQWTTTYCGSPSLGAPKPFLMGWETLAGKTEFIHTQTVLIFNKKVWGGGEAPVSIPKEVESVHGQWFHWTGATPTKAQRVIKACFKFSDGRAEPSAPHPADERAAGSHAHPGGRLLAFLLHRACFQVQHSPCGGKDKRCVSDGRLQALGPTGRAGRPLDLCCCSLPSRAAPAASPCRPGAADRRGRSRTNRTATG